MQWVSAFIDSVSAVLGGERPGQRSSSECELARAALLELLDDQTGFEAIRIRQRIFSARQPDVWWLLRADVAVLVGVSHRPRLQGIYRGGTLA